MINLRQMKFGLYDILKSIRLSKILFIDLIKCF